MVIFFIKAHTLLLIVIRFILQFLALYFIIFVNLLQASLLFLQLFKYFLMSLENLW